MAIVWTPTGLTPVRFLNGASWNQQANLYYVPSTDTNAYYPGDPVLSTNTSDANGVSGVVKATLGTETLRGVVVGVLPYNPASVSLVGSALNLENQFAPTNKLRDYYLLVADDPAIIFAVTDDNITTANLVAANANKNCSLTIASPAAGGPQVSATVILSSSIATTNTLNIKLMGLMQVPGNAYSTLPARWLCMINQHELRMGTAGV